MKIPNEVNIYGTKYDVFLIKEPDKYMYENSAWGYCDFDGKKIYILKNKESKSTYLHELIHAHLWECGCQSFASNETMVELITEMFERIRNL